MTTENLDVRAVNLGGWLVVEGWMKPSLFYDIPNKDLLDGTKLLFKSVKTGKYLSAENGGGGNIVADKDDASLSEIFRLWRIDENTFNFRVANRKFMGLSKVHDTIKFKTAAAEDDQEDTEIFKDKLTLGPIDNIKTVAAEDDQEDTEIFKDKLTFCPIRNTRVVAVEDEPEHTEIFKIHRRKVNDQLTLARIEASNGFFLQVRSEKLVTADYRGKYHRNNKSQDYEWCLGNPSVFILTVDTVLRGEYQITNGYGPKRAPQVMREHWSTYIVEEDFKFIKENGLNTVRIPLGWWTAHDPEPPAPYVAGSLEFLDKAFDWADKYGIKVIIDLHAAPGSQSGWEPSSSRDGEEDWDPQTEDSVKQRKLKLRKPNFWRYGEEDWDPQAESYINQRKLKLKKPSIIRDGELDWNLQTKSYIDLCKLKLIEPSIIRDGFHEWVYDKDHIKHSVDVIDFFTERYAMRPSLFGVELLNEPRKPLVRLNVLIDYYKRGYEAVRKHSKDAYVVMCDRLGLHGQHPCELVELALTLDRSVIDVHYYNMFAPIFFTMNAQENINYLRENRATEIKHLRHSGVHLLVGEFVASWQVKNASEEDFKRFVDTKVEVYGGATFGWAYWSLKNFYNHWSLEWMIKNKYITLPTPK